MPSGWILYNKVSVSISLTLFFYKLILFDSPLHSVLIVIEKFIVIPVDLLLSREEKVKLEGKGLKSFILLFYKGEVAYELRWTLLNHLLVFLVKHVVFMIQEHFLAFVVGYL